MAVTTFESGFSMTAVADSASFTGQDFIVYSVIIVKAIAGTVTLKDGNGVVCLLTGTLADASTNVYPMGGWSVSALEYDAVSAGTAVVYAYGRPGAG